MTSQQNNEFIRKALDSARGDDFERANNTFDRMTEEQLNKQYGQSGRTCREVWQGYKDHRAEWLEAKEYFEQLVG